MPTYDYRCKACGHQWELFQSINDNPIKKCPNCKKARAERIIGAGAGILFKGSGFYQTDYRSSAYKKAADADKKSSEGSAAKPDSGTAAKSESKSEPKSDSKSKSKD